MATVGYARVSTTGQSLEVQREMLSECDKVFEEKKSGLDGNRKELARCLEYVREGDTLIVTKLDRIARSTSDFYKITETLREKGVHFKCMDHDFDTNTKTGKLMVGLLALIAEFEADIRKERQAEGIAKARADGKQLGRTRQVTPEFAERVKVMKAEGNTIREIMKATGMSKASVYRGLAAP